MKLIQKFTLWYLVATFLVLVVGGFFSFQSIKKEVDREQARYLKKNIDFTIQHLTNGVIPDSLFQNKIEVQKVSKAEDENEFLIKDTLVWHGYLKRMEPQIKVSTVRNINGQHFYISTYGAIVDTGDITYAVFKSSIIIFLIMLIVAGIISVFISKKILAPFNKTLGEMQSFRLSQKRTIQLPNTHTTEFKKLNSFLEEMTNKAQEDYRNLKEFTENASHELQTPLAIIRGKLELMMDSSLNNQQAGLISSAHNAVEKLSKINQSLSLLTKLDNHEFEITTTINFSQQLKDSLFAFQELIEMKSLQLETIIAEDVYIKIHPLLNNILLNNLLSNAIRHNREFGMIKIDLSPQSLKISNTGEHLDLQPNDLFKRFKKNDPSSDSIGLGLAIVKHICEQSNIKITYTYRDEMHTLHLIF
jgi:signal transduction histidine kinase